LTTIRDLALLAIDMEGYEHTVLAAVRKADLDHFITSVADLPWTISEVELPLLPDDIASLLGKFDNHAARLVVLLHE